MHPCMDKQLIECSDSQKKLVYHEDQRPTQIYFMPLFFPSFLSCKTSKYLNSLVPEANYSVCLVSMK